MKENQNKSLSQIAVRLGIIATNQSLALSVCESKDALKEHIRTASKEIHAIADSLLCLAEKGGEQ